MISTSALEIQWVKPAIAEEQWEFFMHPAKQEYYSCHGIQWEQILIAFDCGKLVPYPRSDRIGDLSVAMSYDTYDDYSRYLAKSKRGYRKNYVKMEEQLQRNGTLTLKAPIILKSGQDGLLFSGYRRLCLAWNYGMVPYAWLVTLDICRNTSPEE